MKDTTVRLVLKVGAAFNFSAAALILFAASLGRLADLPPDAPHLYSWMLAAFVFLFGGVYLWLPNRDPIDRPLVAVAALGKFAVFLVSLVCLILSEISIKTLAPAVIDLLFGILFVTWLRGAGTRSGQPVG